MSVLTPKIIKLSRLLSKDMRSEEIQEIWNQFSKEILQTEFEYFSNLRPEDIIKIVITIYSIKQTNDIVLAEKILNDMFFFYLLEISDEKHVESCDDCGGGGYETCNNCDGDGNINCSSCNSKGKLECSNCDGSGYIDGDDDESIQCDECGGSGEITCDDCDGDGYYQCGECFGGGSQSCTSCGGDGDITTEENEWMVQFYCSWDQELKNILELKCGTIEGLFEENFSNTPYRKNSFKISFVVGHDEFSQFINSDYEYCLGMEDSPALYWERNHRIGPRYYIHPSDNTDFVI